MDVWQAALLGAIQGLTEFLPVSSSGHLVLGQYFLGITEGHLTMTIILHFGSLVAVFVAMWYRLEPVITGSLRGVPDLVRLKWPKENTDFLWGVYIIVGTIPAVVIGLSFKDEIESSLEDPRFACAMLIVTGIILFSTRFVRARPRPLGWLNSLVIGLGQALAILPGISRSGTTISTGLWLGIDRKEAAEFSFLLSIPVILGPSLIEIGAVVSDPQGNAVPLAAGFLTAAVSGYFAIRLLLRFVQQGRFSWFAYYCWAVGLAGLIFIGS